MTTCADVMTRDPVSVAANDSAEHVAQLMRSSDVGSIPIVDQESHLVGIITDRDLALQVVAHARDPRQTQVGSIMTPDPAACKPSDDVECAIEVMEERQVRRVPVVDYEKRLVGMIAQADIATRLHSATKTAEVVEEISQPTSGRSA